MVKQDVLACEWSIEIHQPCNQALKGMQLLRVLHDKPGLHHHKDFMASVYTPVQNFQYHLNKQTNKRK